jgi:hypothetical protein
LIERHPHNNTFIPIKPAQGRDLMPTFSSILFLALLPALSSAATGGVYQGWNIGAKNASSSYRFYQGDGTEISGWHAMSEWLDFDTM